MISFYQLFYWYSIPACRQTGNSQAHFGVTCLPSGRLAQSFPTYGEIPQARFIIILVIFIFLVKKI